MTLSYPLKNYSWQQLARPMLLLSIGIHGLLLFTPMPTQKAEPTKKDKTQNKIKITQLPISSNPQRVIKKPANLAVTSSIIRQTNRLTINQHKSINQPVIKFAEVASKPTKQNHQIASTPAETIALPNPNNLNDPFGDFPKYINSQPGIGLFTAPINQNSQQTQDSVTIVSQYFERELKAREYKITIVKNEANAKVFELKKAI